MGLDMYLNGKRYLSDWDEGDKAIKESVNQLFEGTPMHGKIKEVSAEVMYWRKANAIHNWFVKNCQDGRDECQTSYVSREQLTELRDLCREILADKRAATKLPPTSGFFFGSTEIDEHYFGDLACTAEGLDDIIDNPDAYKEWDFYYRASW